MVACASDLDAVRACKAGHQAIGGRRAFFAELFYLAFLSI
jgi:hypothetical protein